MEGIPSSSSSSSFSSSSFAFSSCFSRPPPPPPPSHPPPYLHPPSSFLLLLLLLLRPPRCLHRLGPPCCRFSFFLLIFILALARGSRPVKASSPSVGTVLLARKELQRHHPAEEEQKEMEREQGKEREQEKEEEEEEDCVGRVGSRDFQKRLQELKLEGRINGLLLLLLLAPLRSLPSHLCCLPSSPSPSSSLLLSPFFLCQPTPLDTFSPPSLPRSPFPALLLFPPSALISHQVTVLSEHARAWGCGRRRTTRFGPTPSEPRSQAPWQALTGGGGGLPAAAAAADARRCGVVDAVGNS
eukprot:751417-Hanusia_phi.AAC.1